jgi:hypothetical protein
VTAFLALAGALILAGVATFGFFGGYWWQYWEQIRETANEADGLNGRQMKLTAEWETDDD